MPRIIVGEKKKYYNNDRLTCTDRPRAVPKTRRPAGDLPRADPQEAGVTCELTCGVGRVVSFCTAKVSVGVKQRGALHIWGHGGFTGTQLG